MKKALKYRPGHMAVVSAAIILITILFEILPVGNWDDTSVDSNGDGEVANTIVKRYDKDYGPIARTEATKENSSSIRQGSLLFPAPTRQFDDHIVAIALFSVTSATMVSFRQNHAGKVRGYKITFDCEHSYLVYIAWWRWTGEDMGYCKTCKRSATIIDVKPTSYITIEIPFQKAFRLKCRKSIEKIEQADNERVFVASMRSVVRRLKSFVGNHDSQKSLNRR